MTQSDMITPPPGALVRMLSHIQVKKAKSWDDAVSFACYGSTPNDEVLQLGAKYEDCSLEEKEYDFVLVNYPNGKGEWGKTIEWAISQGLKKTTPCEIFSICRRYTILNFTLGVNTVYLICTEERMLGDERCTLAIWYHKERGVICHKLRFSGDFTDWFVFRR